MSLRERESISAARRPREEKFEKRSRETHSTRLLCRTKIATGPGSSTSCRTTKTWTVATRTRSRTRTSPTKEPTKDVRSRCGRRSTRPCRSRRSASREKASSSRIQE